MWWIKARYASHCRDAQNNRYHFGATLGFGDSPRGGEMSRSDRGDWALFARCLRSRLKGGSIGSSLSGSANS